MTLQEMIENLKAEHAKTGEAIEKIANFQSKGELIESIHKYFEASGDTDRAVRDMLFAFRKKK